MRVTKSGVLNTATHISGMKNPYGFALDSANNLYVADRNNSLIVKFDKNGVRINTEFGGPLGGFYVSGLYVAYDVAGDRLLLSRLHSHNIICRCKAVRNSLLVGRRSLRTTWR